MELNPQIAKSIVDSLKSTIDHEINLFDTNGIIIASTDKKRIGTQHEGAQEVLRTNQVNIINEDNINKGVRKGINMPILFNNTTVAIIGITGDPREIEAYGTIIKKMTEILIRENWLQINSFNDRNNMDHLVSMLISEQQDHELIATLASMTHVDLSVSYYVAVANIPRDKWLIFRKEDFQHKLELFLIPYQISLYTITNYQLCLLLPKRSKQELSQLLNQLATMIGQLMGKTFTIGVSTLAQNYQQIGTHYHEAQRALQWGIFQQQEAICYYKQLAASSELIQLPSENMANFVDKVLGNIPNNQKEDYHQLISAYRETNGSILQGAANLFIHKNTFQNRLNKFHQLTGYNPRELKDFMLIDLAFEFDCFLNFLQDTALAGKGIE